MKCNKCQSELSEGSKFCPNCGNEISKEKSMLEMANEGMNMHLHIGYLFGFMRGKFIGHKKKEKDLKEFEDTINEIGLGEEYKETVDFWKNKAKGLIKEENVEKCSHPSGSTNKLSK